MVSVARKAVVLLSLLFLNGLAGASDATDLLDPTICFVKLAPNAKRTKADVQALAATWEALTVDRFPDMAYKLLVVDRETVAVQTKSLDEAPKLKDFFLGLDVVHEVQVGQEVFGRPGQPALQELKATLAKEARKAKRSKLFQFFKRKRGPGAMRRDGKGKQRRRAIAGKKQEL